MAKNYKNKQGFLIIEMTPKEAKSVHFGVGEGCICMHCNDICKDKIYYIAALNDVMDKECLEEWLETAIRYEEDKKWEIRNYEFYSKFLNINE